MPAWGGTCGTAWGCGAVWVPVGAAVWRGAGAGAGAGTGLGAGFGAVAPTVTIGAILAIVLADTPTLFRSSTEANGRPAMIFFAVAAPTPGSASSWDCVAVFKSTGPAGAGAAFAKAGAASVKRASGAAARRAVNLRCRESIEAPRSDPGGPRACRAIAALPRAWLQPPSHLPKRLPVDSTREPPAFDPTRA